MPETETKKHSKWWMPIILSTIALVPSGLSFLLSKHENEQKAKFNYETFAKQFNDLQEEVGKQNQTIIDQNLKIAKLEGRCEERSAMASIGLGSPGGFGRGSGRGMGAGQGAPEPRPLEPPVPNAPPPVKKLKPLKQDFDSAYQDSKQQEQIKK